MLKKTVLVILYYSNTNIYREQCVFKLLTNCLLSECKSSANVFKNKAIAKKEKKYLLVSNGWSHLSHSCLLGLLGPQNAMGMHYQSL